MKKIKKRVRGGASLPCPSCGGPTRAVETRLMTKDRAVRRKRKCPKCSRAFESEERPS